MRSDPNRPEVLLSVSNEIEAGVIVTALAEYGIEALTTGGYTSGFKAEAPGYVAILVKQADLDRAKQALAEIQQQKDEVDWANVDVMEGAEAESQPDESPGFGAVWYGVPGRLWLVGCLLEIAGFFIIGLLAGEVTRPLTYGFALLILITFVWWVLVAVARREK